MPVKCPMFHTVQSYSTQQSHHTIGPLHAPLDSVRYPVGLLEDGTFDPLAG